MISAALAVLAFLIAFVGTCILRHHALRRNVLDIPNARSSHTVPTPRGGGLAIVSAVTAALLILGLFGFLARDLLLTLAGGGVAVAIVGYLDDRRSLPVIVRIIAHFAAAVWVIWALGGVPMIQWGSATVDLGILGDLLGTLAVVWLLNLFNFMDGIDGIAASEAVFVAGAGAVLWYFSGSSSSMFVAALVIAAASLGFLIWNWPPAKIFMGDVGSGYLGYVLAVLALAASRENPALLFGWLILGGFFLVDATVTLMRRLVRRERVYEAHRGHAYQRLARRWGSHRPVTLSVIALNVFWLLPCAWLAVVFPQYAVWITFAALTPVAALVWFLGAGQLEDSRS